jgi:aminoglycoside phosphotransferase (APT) family kinase protein
MQPERLAVARAAALAHVPGSGGVTIEPVALGEVNETYRVVRDARHYALRLTRADRPDPGIDRHWECRVLHVAAAHGIAPPLVCCRAEEGVLVLEWSSGAQVSSGQVRARAGLGRIAELVRRVQALPVPPAPRRMSAADWVRHYEERLARAPSALAGDALATLAMERARRLAALEGLPAAAPRLCHGDLHRENLIEAQGRWLLLDWEYAHLADPLWDLAAWVSGNALTPGEVRALLRAFREAAPGATDAGGAATPSLSVDLQRLDLLRWVYEYICLLWALVVQPAPSDLASAATPIAAWLERLRAPPAEAGGGAVQT